DAVNRQSPDTWKMAVSHLSAAEHKALAKGLVRAEEAHNWQSGAASGAISVYAAFAQKFPAEADELADWMLAHSANPWVPFGKNRGSVRSLDEYRRRPSDQNAETIPDPQLALTSEQLAKLESMS